MNESLESVLRGDRWDYVPVSAAATSRMFLKWVRTYAPWEREAGGTKRITESRFGSSAAARYDQSVGTDWSKTSKVNLKVRDSFLQQRSEHSALFSGLVWKGAAA